MLFCEQQQEWGPKQEARACVLQLGPGQVGGSVYVHPSPQGAVPVVNVGGRMQFSKDPAHVHLSGCATHSGKAFFPFGVFSTGKCGRLKENNFQSQKT